MSLSKVTDALRRRLDEHDEFARQESRERGSIPPPSSPHAVELTVERRAEIAKVLKTSHAMLTAAHFGGVSAEEFHAFIDLAKGKP